jgi:hypothetical protein
MDRSRKSVRMKCRYLSLVSIVGIRLWKADGMGNSRVSLLLFSFFHQLLLMMILFVGVFRLCGRCVDELHLLYRDSDTETD